MTLADISICATDCSAGGIKNLAGNQCISECPGGYNFYNKINILKKRISQKYKY